MTSNTKNLIRCTSDTNDSDVYMMMRCNAIACRNARNALLCTWLTRPTGRRTYMACRQNVPCVAYGESSLTLLYAIYGFHFSFFSSSLIFFFCFCSIFRCCCTVPLRSLCCVHMRIHECAASADDCFQSIRSMNIFISIPLHKWQLCYTKLRTIAGETKRRQILFLIFIFSHHNK